MEALDVLLWMLPVTLLGFFIPGCGPCCEEESCEVFADNFDRSNTSSIGADWTEVTGNWEILSNKLKLPSGTTNGVATCATSSSGLTVIASVVVQVSASSTRARVIVNYVDVSNYTFGELFFNGSSSRVTLFNRSAGTNTQIAQSATFTLSTSTDYRLSVCINSTNRIVAQAKTNALAVLATVATDTITPTTSVCGLGCGSLTSGNLLFNDFVIEKSRTNDSGEEECTACVDTCCPADVPTVATLTLSGITGTGCCTSFNDAFELPFCVSAMINNVLYFPANTVIHKYILDLSDFACAPDLNTWLALYWWCSGGNIIITAYLLADTSRPPDLTCIAGSDEFESGDVPPGYSWGALIDRGDAECGDFFEGPFALPFSGGSGLSCTLTGSAASVAFSTP